MEVRLSEEERELLLEVLQEQHKHLLREIAKAHHYECKTTLRQRCTVLEGIMHNVQHLAYAAV